MRLKTVISTYNKLASFRAGFTISYASLIKLTFFLAAQENSVLVFGEYWPFIGDLDLGVRRILAFHR